MLGQNDQQLGYLGHEKSSKMSNYNQDILGTDVLSHSDSSPVPNITSRSEQDVVTAFLESSGFTNQSVVTDVGPQLSHVEGKCIVLQGKRYTLMTHETGSSTKTIPGHARLNGSKDYPLECCLDDIKARLRTSFTIYIKEAAELHLLSAVQAIERALVGVQECCTAKYGITFGRVEGTVSPVVAAGIDLLDMLLENVSGQKRLSVVRRHIQSVMAGLFIIILHVRSPLIFFESPPGMGFGDPDPGSVTLTCIEVLTRVSGGRALFQLDPWHVAQMLRMPAVLFQVFCQFQLKDPISSESLFSLKNLDIDQLFSVKLHATCCQLLCTILKHHKSECKRDIALLQDSTSVLVNCLETVNMDLVVRRGYLSRDEQEGAK
ncbi:hypothetical protein NL676_038411 [Syzygium grande]|nr:hypothetical protein NL676_038411 [Syzygium grande]